jgi:hypothetical protein
LNDIGRNSLMGNRKKIAKFLMRTFTCRSTFLYECPPSFDAFVPLNLSEFLKWSALGLGLVDLLSSSQPSSQVCKSIVLTIIYSMHIRTVKKWSVWTSLKQTKIPIKIQTKSFDF